MEKRVFVWVTIQYTQLISQTVNTPSFHEMPSFSGLNERSLKTFLQIMSNFETKLKHFFYSFNPNIKREGF